MTAAGRAYIVGGLLCENAQGFDCKFTTSVEMLDMSIGAWQSFPVSLGRATYLFEPAVLDHQLGTLLSTNCTVTDRFSDECSSSPTTTEGEQQADF